MKPDYYKYSESQLHDVLNVIDREAYPERVAEIEAILADEKALKRARRIQQRQDKQREENRLKSQAYIGMILPLFYGLILVFAGVSVNRHGIFHDIVNPYLRYGFGGLMIFLGCVQTVRIIWWNRK